VIPIITSSISSICITHYNSTHTTINSVQMMICMSNISVRTGETKHHTCITPHASNTATVSTTDSNPPITSHILMFLHLILSLTLLALWRKTVPWKQATSAKCQILCFFDLHLDICVQWTQADALFISVYSVTITLHVLGLLLAHHQEVTMYVCDSWYMLYVLVDCQ
jgi:hypothetical protein